MNQENSTTIFTSPLVRRIFLLFVICALVPVLSLSVVTHWQVTKQMERQLQQRLRHVTKNVGMSIFDSLSHLESELIGLSNILTKKTLDSVLGTQDFISEEEKKTIRALAIIKSNGLLQPLIGSFPPLDMLSDLDRNTSVFFVPNLDKSMMRIFMAVPRDQQHLTGEYLLAELNPADIWEQPLRAVSPEAIVSILAPDGTLVFTSAHLPSSILKKTLTRSQKFSTGPLEWNDGQKSYLANYWTIFLKGTFSKSNLIVLINEEKIQAVASIHLFSQYFLLVCILTLLLVVLLSSVYVRRTLRPLSALQRGTRLIGNGDFKQRVVVESNDEFSELADSFNVMAARIDDHFHDINQTSQTVRLILSALDRQKLIDTVLNQINTIIPCAQVSFSLLQPDCTDTIHSTTFSPENPQIDPIESISILNETEMKNIQDVVDYRLLDSFEPFSDLLAPLNQVGYCRFLCLPLFHNRLLTGIISLRITEKLPLPPETLLRARQVADQVAIALTNTRLVEELDQLNWGTLQALARTVDANSHWTAGHSERVASLALNIGEKMGLTPSELDYLHRGALLHDIGKIGCPNTVLDKPTELTVEEFELLKQHPALGAKILEPIAIYQAIIPMVRHHHERYDGSGYPHGLAGTEICRDARILIIADVFDALISHRPYRRRWELEKARTYMAENVGIIFDPEMVKIFLEQVIPEIHLNDFLPQVEFTAKNLPTP